jgi:hypothetical protein
MYYLGYKLDEDFVDTLSKLFPFKFKIKPDHHITYQLKTKPSAFLPLSDNFKIVGYTSDDSLECFKVELDNDPTRYDGECYHLTWSYDEGRRPRESNDILKTGFQSIDEIQVKGAWEFKLMG